jgi:hypothetical protein
MELLRWAAGGWGIPGIMRWLPERSPAVCALIIANNNSLYEKIIDHLHPAAADHAAA